LNKRSQFLKSPRKIRG